MEVVARTGPDIDGLSERARAAVSPEDRAACLRDIEASLEGATGPLQRGQLLMCRARVRSNQWRTRAVLEDALAAVALFDQAGEAGRALDATSLAAAFASRLGELSLAAELATRTILGLDSVGDDWLVAEITNRLGIFCYSFLHYDRAVSQMQASLAAAERAGDRYQAHRQLLNIADALLLAVRAGRASGAPPRTPPLPMDQDRLERAGQALQRVLTEAAPVAHFSLVAHRLRAELLLELGRPEEALQVVASAPGGAGMPDAQASAFSLVESRCLRTLGRGREAVEAAERAVRLAQASGDDLELMLTLEERMAARQSAGDLAGALADAVEAKSRMWVIHQRQTAQVVEEVWVRADLERESRRLEETTAAAVRTAEEDALTRVGNRRRLERFLARAGEAPVSLALVMADIDYFKEINDTYGHELGDMVLRALAELFATETRPGQVVVRYGGEEFVFAMLGVEQETAMSFAERVRTRVASYAWDSLDTRLGVTISLGVSAGRSDSWHSVLAAADDALYMAKRLGRNRVETAQSQLQQTAG